MQTVVTGTLSLNKERDDRMCKEEIMGSNRNSMVADFARLVLASHHIILGNDLKSRIWVTPTHYPADQHINELIINYRMHWDASQHQKRL